MVRLRLLSILAIGFAVALSAQQTPSPLIPRTHEGREQRYYANHHVILNVLVTDAKGRPATGLKQEDFSLLDNHLPQKITTFREIRGSDPAARVHVILILDILNNKPASIVILRKALERFLGQNQGRIAYPTEIAVLSGSGLDADQSSADGYVHVLWLKKFFSSPHAAGCEWEERSGKADNAIAGLISEATPPFQTDSAQATCSNLRYRVSLSELNRLAKQQADVVGRAIVIWLGSGWPDFTNAEFLPQTTGQKRNTFDYLVNLATSLREAQITLDSVASLEASSVSDSSKDAGDELAGGPTGDQLNPSGLSLVALARQTGGQVFAKSQDMAREISACLSDAESWYALSFDSAPVVTGAAYRSLEVEVSSPGLRVRTNTAYYAQP
jgi:VWFA-related protein